jgi:hypothetical protein
MEKRNTAKRPQTAKPKKQSRKKEKKVEDVRHFIEQQCEHETGNAIAQDLRSPYQDKEDARKQEDAGAQQQRSWLSSAARLTQASHSSPTETDPAAATPYKRSGVKMLSTAAALSTSNPAAAGKDNQGNRGREYQRVNAPHAAGGTEGKRKGRGERRLYPGTKRTSKPERRTLRCGPRKRR